MNTVKIILVDDLKDNLLALEGLLRQDGIDIMTARSGTDALDLMISHDFALALIDVQMPGMSGFELAELMRGTNKTKNVPIIFVTANSKNSNFSFKGYESGAVDFLLKPLDTHAVKSKVNIFIALNRAHHEQRALLEKLRETRKDLEKSVRIRDEFMSIVSHELKTPLTSLGLQVQLRQRLLSKGEMARFTPERLAKMFESDQKQIARIAHLIDDMLDISRISTGRLSINKDRFDLSELVKDLVEQTSEQFVASHCSVKVNAATPIIGNWDRFRIEQVVMNLLTNAMRYGCSKPILIEVTATASHARISVSDHGVGIEIKDLERIFERFERAVSGNEISGLGLGLYITKQILEAHQGSIRVESTLGLGSTFVVELPLRTAGDPPFEPDLANPVVVTDSIQ